MPRIDWATKSIKKEYEWVPQIENLLSTPISAPVFKGSASSEYPYEWLVTKWNDGANPNFEISNEHNQLAKDLALFLNDFHGIVLENGPESRRGVPLIYLNDRTRDCIYQLEGEIDVNSTTTLWDELCNIDYWDRDPVWVHGDFLPGNILVKEGRLSSVIDFSDVGVGDPACDLVIAWSLFNHESRLIFKCNLEGIDENTWQRGRGWALSIAAIMLPYYKNTNPVLAKLARRILSQVLA